MTAELFNGLARFNVCCTSLTSFNQFISVPSVSQVSDEGFCQSDGVLSVTKGCPDEIFISPQSVSKVSQVISHKSEESSSSFRASSLHSTSWVIAAGSIRKSTGQVVLCVCLHQAH